ncbi:MAG: AAA family ATPase [Sulfuriferula sp.]|nr:AAA family ATPase [Sulfuriferula sp.]
MITFDQILPKLIEVFTACQADLTQLGEMIINRDLNGRVRLIANDTIEGNPSALAALTTLCEQMVQALGNHAFTVNQLVIFESDVRAIRHQAPSFLLADFTSIYVIDRLATEGSWATISEESTTAPRIVFFSIKGGVGRSTALAVTAWSLAEQGKKVLVLDLDLESPGLSSNLLPEERRPTFGITDWLVEDLVDNSDMIFKDMVVTSELSRNGDIYVVPAHGRDIGEYIAKLGRVWMPKIGACGKRESWSERLERLIGQLESKYLPDVILIDSRAGIDEIASACVTDLKANLVLLFALAGAQTWTGYSILFSYWHRLGVIQKIRERLQIVAAMIPDDERRIAYIEDLRDQSQITFINDVYDELTQESDTDAFNFDELDESAPHYPLEIRWNTGFSALTSLSRRLESLDENTVKLVFGNLIDNVSIIVNAAQQRKDTL